MFYELKENEPIDLVSGHKRMVFNTKKIVNYTVLESLLLTDGDIAKEDYSIQENCEYKYKDNRTYELSDLKTKRIYLKDFSYAIVLYFGEKIGKVNNQDVSIDYLVKSETYLKNFNDKKALVDALLALKTFKHQRGTEYVFNEYKKPMYSGKFFEKAEMLSSDVCKLKRRK